GAVARCLEACAERCDALFSARPRQAPDFIVLNANHYVFGQFIEQFLVIPQTPYNTHVRKGRARPAQERLYPSHRWEDIEEAMRSAFGYDAGEETLVVGVGDSIDLTTSGSSSGCKDGHWGAMDFQGTWTDGHRAELLLAFDPGITTGVVAEVSVTQAFIGP